MADVLGTLFLPVPVSSYSSSCKWLLGLSRIPLLIALSFLEGVLETDFFSIEVLTGDGGGDLFLKRLLGGPSATAVDLLVLILVTETDASRLLLIFPGVALITLLSISSYFIPLLSWLTAITISRSILCFFVW